MPKKTPPSNVVQLSSARKGKTDNDALHEAQLKIYDAWESTGKQRIALANQALKLSKDCADAYLILANEARDRDEEIRLLREAVDAGTRAAGKDWEKKYKGVCWLALETRPVMRAMARLAIALQRDDEFDEALSLYRKLMKINPNDNQGIRYLLAICLYEANLGDELERLLKENDGDTSASLLYTKALHLFRKKGKTAAKPALMEAYRANPHVPIFLSDEVEMPSESPSSIGFGDEREAIAYVLNNGYIWFDTEGSTEWMADTLEKHLPQLTNDKELIAAVLAGLRQEYDD